MADTPVKVDNFINGEFLGSDEYLDVQNPATGAVIGSVALAGDAEIEKALEAAQNAFANWSGRTIKARAAIMLKFHALVQQNAQELAEIIVKENGKNITEALADVAKGNETVEYACSLPQLAAGNILQVSSGGVFCQDVRRPLGVVVSIVPFNFPFMVPFWTIPVALVMGNALILKPSEKVPLTMRRVAELLIEAGVPPGVFGMVQGQAAAVQKLIHDERVKAVTFVGSSPIAKLVKEACNSIHKRCTALGGAKNHLVALTDCHVDQTARDVVTSFAGCAGQRCMAASVLLVIGDQPRLIERIVEFASKLRLGTEPGQVGPVIDAASHSKIHSYLEIAEADRAKVLLDGRKHSDISKEGNWVGPTVLLHSSPQDRTMREEVFGPVLSVYVCKDWQEAIAIENSNPFGNAASVYTCNGGHAQWFHERFRAGMLGKFPDKSRQQCS